MTIEEQKNSSQELRELNAKLDAEVKQLRERERLSNIGADKSGNQDEANKYLAEKE